MASWPKSSPLPAREATSCALWEISSSCCGVAAAGSDSRMCETLNSSFAAAFCSRARYCSSSCGETLICAMTSRCRKRAQGQFLAHRFAILLVIDSLRRQRRRQLIEGDLVARGDFLQGAIQLLIGNRQAHVLGALQFEFPAAPGDRALAAAARFARAARLFVPAGASATEAICSSSSLLSTRPSLTMAAIRSSSSPCTLMSRVCARDGDSSKHLRDDESRRIGTLYA